MDAGARLWVAESPWPSLDSGLVIARGLWGEVTASSPRRPASSQSPRSGRRSAESERASLLVGDPEKYVYPHYRFDPAKPIHPVFWADRSLISLPTQ